MEQLGAIEKVDQPTEWVNSIVIVEKEDGNLRICLDPKDLNRAVQLKRRARDLLLMCCPNMNAQIRDLISNCSSCLKHRKNNAKEPLIQHEVPHRPWEKIACDLFTLGGKD